MSRSPGHLRGLDMFDQFTGLVANASGWAYLIILAFSLFDAVFPVLPSEATVITAGVVAASGKLSLPLVILTAAIGAFAGDNLAYWLGRSYGEWVSGRLFKGPKARKRLAWTERQLDERGGEMVTVARFIPGGRTAVTLSAGMLGYPWLRFMLYDGIAAVCWALYAALLGYVGGRVFEHETWKGLLLAFSLALGVTGGIEGVRWWLRRRSGADPEPTVD